MGLNMAQLVEKAGGARAALGVGLAGLIGVAGIAVAVTLASCEVSSRTTRRTPSESPKTASLPRVNSQVETHAKGAPSSTPVAAAGQSVAAAPLPTSEPQMRVRIMAGTETVRITCPGGVEIGQGDPKGATTLSPGAKTEKRAGVMVTLRGGQWQVAELGVPGVAGAMPGNGVGSMAHSFPTTLSLVVLPSVSGQMLSVNGTPYPGTIRLSSRTEVRADAFDVVDFVGIEDYLPGVVAKEMLVGWPLGAYQAQAVAARTYALHERQRCGSAAFDVESTDRDQVYGGATTNTTAREAVRSTRGVVLLDGDKLLRTYFSSTCGGRTAAARETWPIGPGYEYNLAGPIQEHKRDFACQASPLFRWTVERPRWELAQRLKWYGERNGFPVKKIKDLRSIDVASVNSDGRPNRYRISDASGAQYTLSAEETRLACNTNANGSLITLAPTAGADTPGLSLLNGEPATAAIGFGGAAGTSGRAPMAAMPAAVPAAAALTVPDIERKTRVHSGDFEVVIRGDKVMFSGRGFGHGVGLCQYCAKAFAERGEDWRTMLERFYPGARVTNLY
jgi:stage II sporulation protein D